MTDRSQEIQVSLGFFWMAGLVKIYSGAPALTKSSGCHSAGTHYVSIMLVIRLNKLKRHDITVIVSYKTEGRRNNGHAY